MTALSALPLSVLDLCPITAGGSAADALRHSIDLAQHCERLGYRRYWLAEHHNIPSVASSATAVVIGQIAAATAQIRVGSGGIMLPNHAPLVIAEQFGTLESLFPGRIDLGLGRAPGSDQLAARALRRQLGDEDNAFPAQLDELRGYFRAPAPGQKLRAIPGAGLDIPLWLLGSAGFSAQLAGRLGLPFAFAAQFAPNNTEHALAIYRRSFVPSAVLAEPYAMVGINVIAADSEGEAQRLATSHQQAFLNLIRGTPAPLPEPVEDMAPLWLPHEQAAVLGQLRASFVGTPDSLPAQLEAFVKDTQADELIVNSAIFDHTARRHSYELLMGLARG